MKQIIFECKESEEGGFIAGALGHSIITNGDTLEELRINVKEAVKCHFNQIIILRIVKEEAFMA